MPSLTAVAAIATAAAALCAAPAAAFLPRSMPALTGSSRSLPVTHVTKGQSLENQFITLQQYLKYQTIVSTGGEAKDMILAGACAVNGEQEDRRGRKLRMGDVVEIGDVRFRVKWDASGKLVRVGDEDDDDEEEEEGGYEYGAEVDAEAATAEEVGEDELDELGEDDDELLGDFNLDMLEAEMLEDKIDTSEDDDVDGVLEGEEEKAFAMGSEQDFFEEESVDDEGGVEAARSRGTALANTRGGLELKLRWATRKDLETLARTSWAPKDLPPAIHADPSQPKWICAELAQGFGGFVGVAKVASDADIDGSQLLLSALTVAPSSRQRGVGGVLVEFAVATTTELDPDAHVCAYVPRYKNTKAKLAVKEMLAVRGVGILTRQ